MTTDIRVGEFFRAAGFDPHQGLKGPMRGTQPPDDSVREFIRRRTPGWDTVKGCFTPDDIYHMKYGINSEADHPGGYPISLDSYDDVQANAAAILESVTTTDPNRRMPPVWDGRDAWGPSFVSIFHRWSAGGTPH